MPSQTSALMMQRTAQDQSNEGHGLSVNRLICLCVHLGDCVCISFCILCVHTLGSLCVCTRGCFLGCRHLVDCVCVHLCVCVYAVGSQNEVHISEIQHLRKMPLSYFQGSLKGFSTTSHK